MLLTRKPLINGVLATAVGVASLGFANPAMASTYVAPAMTDGAPTCTVTAVGGDDTTGMYPQGRIDTHDNVVTGYFEVTGESNCKVNVTLTSWTAPNNFDGKPYDQQVLFDTKTQQYSVGTHDLTIHIPDCNFQADLVRGDEATGYDGGAIYEEGRMMASLHGGDTTCPGYTEQPTDNGGGNGGDTGDNGGDQGGGTGNEGGSGGGGTVTPAPTPEPVTPVVPVAATPVAVATPAKVTAFPAVLPETGMNNTNVSLLALALSLATALGVSVKQRRSGL